MNLSAQRGEFCCGGVSRCGKIFVMIRVMVTDGFRNETVEHDKLKNLVNRKFNEWFGISLTEFASSGNELDVYTVMADGSTIMVEVIWTASKANFFRDLNLLSRSDARLKILIVNPKIASSVEYQREMIKTRVAELKNGRLISEMFDGKKILEDSTFVNGEFKEKITSLLDQCKKLPTQGSNPREAVVWLEGSEGDLVEDVKGQNYRTVVMDQGGRGNTIRDIEGSKDVSNS